MIPFGKAKVVHPGTDLTVITYGAVVPRALQAAQKLEREQGVRVELIDLRCLNPFDWDTIAASVAKTNRALVAYEDTLSWGYGAEIAARIADQLFDQARCPRPPRGRERRLCRLPAHPGRCHPASAQRSIPGDEGTVGVLRDSDRANLWPRISRGFSRIKLRIVLGLSAISV